MRLGYLTFLFSSFPLQMYEHLGGAERFLNHCLSSYSAVYAKHALHTQLLGLFKSHHEAHATHGVDQLGFLSAFNFLP
jgi:hypothetical protein